MDTLGTRGRISNKWFALFLVLVMAISFFTVLPRAEAVNMIEFDGFLTRCTDSDSSSGDKRTIQNTLGKVTNGEIRSGGKIHTQTGGRQITSSYCKS